MSTKITSRNRRFCIFDYFLDGVYLTWEEVEGQCPVLIPGDDWDIRLEDGTQITAKIIEIEDVSENECRIYLNSN